MKKLLLIFLLQLVLVSIGFAQNWGKIKNAPVVKNRFDDIYFVNDTLGWAVDGFGNIYKRGVKDAPWENQFNTGHYNRSIEFLNDSTGIVGSIDTTVYMTTDAGTTWNTINDRFPVQPPGVCGIAHRGDSLVMVGTYYGLPYIMRSYDRAQTWQYEDMSSLANGLVDAWYKSRDTIFVCGISKAGRGIIFRSANAGASWQEVSPESSVSRGFAWKLQFPTASVGYASLEEVDLSDHDLSNATHILKTTDGGRTWVVMNTNIGSNIDLQGIGFINANRGWIGGWSVGMYETNDGGTSWKLINQFANLNRFFYIKPDRAYFSGTTIFEFNKDVVTGIQKADESRDVHSLEVYPNPAHDHAIAKLTLGVHTMVVLTLSDMTGRTIKEIYRGYTEPGVQEHYIDLKGIAPGEYALILLTHEHFLGKKLVKLKN